jgi:hypothetical protein
MAEEVDVIVSQRRVIVQVPCPWRSDGEGKARPANAGM